MKRLARCICVVSILFALPLAGWTAEHGHYLVLKVDRLGNVTPVFHRMVDVEARAAPTQVARDQAKRTRRTIVAEARKWSEIATGLQSIRGEFAEDDAIGSIRGHHVPVFEQHFVLRIPASAGSQLSVTHNGKKTVFDLDEIAARSSAFPLARSSGTRLKSAAASNSGNRLDIIVVGEGYTAEEQSQFNSHVDALRDKFTEFSPFREYAGFVNWEPLFVASSQSGADHPPYNASCTTPSCCSATEAQHDPRSGLFVDTAFDGKFCTSQIHRLLTVSNSKILIAASATPHWDQIIVLVNDPVYGGSGGSMSVVSAHTSANEIAVHEFGHSFARLADEYSSPYPDYPACSDTGGTFACEANVTNQTDRDLIKWRSWIETSTPLPTPPGTAGVGLFEGARYRATGMYRPEHVCQMSYFAAPFCNICAQTYILALYSGGGFNSAPFGGIDLIEPGTESPSPGTVPYTTGRALTFSAAVLRPSPDTTSSQWHLDGQPIPGATSATYQFRQTSATPAFRTLELRVTDNTLFVKDEMAGDVLVHSRSWLISVTPGTPVAVQNDFNGDGRADLLWHNTSTLANTIWQSASNSTTQPVTTVSNASWAIVGIGDFDGDGKSDILWRNTSTLANVIWRSGNFSTQQRVTAVTNSAWTIAGIGDFDGDGKSDILWRNTSTLANVIWKSADYRTQQPVTTITNAAWTIAGIGDFDGDGRSDVLWRNIATLANVIWKSANYRTQQPVTTVSNAAWTIAGVGDFNADGRSDILWHNAASLANAIWKSASYRTQQSVTTVSNAAWTIAGIGDFDGDGKSDIFWRHASSGANAIWLGGSYARQQSVTALPTAWEPHF